jgi:hypothetical protein
MQLEQLIMFKALLASTNALFDLTLIWPLKYPGLSLPFQRYFILC